MGEVRTKLLNAIGAPELRQVWRSIGDGRSEQGFVVGVGERWVLLARTMDGGFEDGYVALRSKDVVRVVKDRSFASRNAALQPEWPRTAPLGIDLDTTRGLLTYLGERGLVGLHRERKRPDEVYVGHLERVGAKRCWLHELDPTGAWTSLYPHPLKKVSRIEWGGHYLRGLAAVAPPVPQSDED